MPEIATQTDECVDVISNLNEEYSTLQMENETLEHHIKMEHKKKMMNDILYMGKGKSRRMIWAFRRYNKEKIRLLILKKASGHGFCKKCDEIFTGYNESGHWTDNMVLCCECSEEESNYSD